MTGILGFIVGAICIGLFAVTANRAYQSVPSRKLQLFTTAFGLFAVAMVLWALIIGFNNPTTTKTLLLASDGLLLIGTGCMVRLLFGATSPLLLTTLGLVGSLAFAVRAVSYQPTGFVHDGLLYFNLNHTLVAIITGAFLAFWLPAVVNVARYFANDRVLVGLQRLLTISFVSLVLVATLFMAARRSYVIISLFVAIVGLFLAMAIMNLLITRLHAPVGEKHAAKSAK